MTPIMKQAIIELGRERRRQAVDAEKAKIIRRKTFWSRIFPFTITITRNKS